MTPSPLHFQVVLLLLPLLQRQVDYFLLLQIVLVERAPHVQIAASFTAAMNLCDPNPAASTQHALPTDLPGHSHNKFLTFNRNHNLSLSLTKVLLL